MLPPDPQQARETAIRRLVLSDFRSYATLDLTIDAPLIAVTGENGTGKTNLLEALSMFTPGRGLRRAELAELARVGGSKGWTVSVEIGPESRHLGTGMEPAEGATRRCRVDRAPVASPRAFADHLRIVWLTPAMDGLFSGSAGERRRFLDRLVLALDSDHAARVSALERALRSRNRLLSEGAADRAWLDATERELAELAIAVCVARQEAVLQLSAVIRAERDATSPFPWADLALEGALDRLVAEASALDAEDRYRAILRDGRPRDAAAGRCLVGPQVSDLLVRYGPKDIEAGRCSTGEQKALLVGLVLAHARLVASMSGFAPLVLLDEIAAHFDLRRRTALFAHLRRLGSQVWMTGAETETFREVAALGQVLHVTPGHVFPFAES